jgi:3-hydroxybutyryl-CoA dehydratase
METHGLSEFRVGESFATPDRTIAESDVMQFSTVTGDHHPQHLDAAWAAESQFGERIVHGMLVVSCAVGLLDLDPERVVAMRSVRDLSFKRPVPVGGTIRVRGHVEEVKEVSGSLAVATLAIYVLGTEDHVAVRGRIEALVRAVAVTS